MNPNNPNPPTGFLRVTSKPAEDPQGSHMAIDTPRNVSLVVDPSTQNTPSNAAPKPPAGALFVDRRQTSSNGYRFRTVLGVERGIEGHDVTVQTPCAQVADGSVDGGLVWPVWPPGPAFDPNYCASQRSGDR